MSLLRTPENDVTPLSGSQHRLRGGGFEVVVASVGASLRVLRDGHGDLVMPFPVDQMRPAMSGALLAPWPNRTADGRYEFEGIVHQLPLSEPELGNAAHGLLTWLDFEVVSKSESDVTLAGTIEAQPGYPWRVRVEVSFEVGADGLRQRVVATNESRQPAPFGLGAHPYLVAGAVAHGAIDEWSLELPADEVMQVSADRLLPTGIFPVADVEGPLDFRDRRVIGSSVVNHAYSGLHRDVAGFARVRVTDPRGFGVEVALDRSLPWVQVYTADDPGAAVRRHAVAVEPMTCPPDALNSARDLIVLEPGATFAAEWRIRRITP
jgi:aldose 1-epimerase